MSCSFMLEPEMWYFIKSSKKSLISDGAFSSLIWRIGTSRRTHLRPVPHGPVCEDLSWSLNRSHTKPPRWAVKLHGREEVPGFAANLDQTTTVGIVKNGVTGHASAGSLERVGLHRGPAGLPEGRSASSPPGRMGSMCTWPSNYTGGEFTDCSVLGATRQLSVDASFQTNRSNQLLRNCSR